MCAAVVALAALNAVMSESETIDVLYVAIAVLRVIT